MPTLMQRLRAFLSGPTGRRLMEQGRRELSKPENQQKLRRMVSKLQQKRR